MIPNQVDTGSNPVWRANFKRVAKMSNINWSLVHEMVEQGYINARPHSEDPSLVIYNYAPKTQYEKKWNEATLACRGLIARGEEIVARPFPKFFNLSEYSDGEIDFNQNYVAYDKADGSLGILYEFAPGDWRISTRGSMESDIAKYATKMLKKYEFAPMDDHTHLFEIIYPSNRIVVDYKGREDLILLGYVNNKTGEIVGPYRDEDKHNFPIVEFCGLNIPVAELPIRENREGYVLFFQSGFQTKVKHEEYLRLHRILTEVSSYTIWEALRDGIPVDAFIDNVPDEFYDWVQRIVAILRADFQSIKNLSAALVDTVKKLETRKEQALKIIEISKGNSILKSVMFAMLDNKPYDDIIWKAIKPEYELPFASGEDA